MLPDAVVPMHVVAQADLRLPEGAEPVPVHEFRLRYAVCGLHDGVVVGAPLRGQRAPGPEGLQHLVNLPVREFAAAVRVVDVDLVQGNSTEVNGVVKVFWTIIKASSGGISP